AGVVIHKGLDDLLRDSSPETLRSPDTDEIDVGQVPAAMVAEGKAEAAATLKEQQRSSTAISAGTKKDARSTLRSFEEDQAKPVHGRDIVVEVRNKTPLELAKRAPDE